MTLEKIRTQLLCAVKRLEEDLSNPLNDRVREYITGKRNGYLTVLRMIIEFEIFKEKKENDNT